MSNVPSVAPGREAIRAGYIVGQLEKLACASLDAAFGGQVVQQGYMLGMLDFKSSFNFFMRTTGNSVAVCWGSYRLYVMRWRLRYFSC